MQQKVKAQSQEVVTEAQARGTRQGRLVLSSVEGIGRGGSQEGLCSFCVARAASGLSFPQGGSCTAQGSCTRDGAPYTRRWKTCNAPTDHNENNTHRMSNVLHSYDIMFIDMEPASQGKLYAHSTRRVATI